MTNQTENDHPSNNLENKLWIVPAIALLLPLLMLVLEIVELIKLGFVYSLLVTMAIDMLFLIVMFTLMLAGEIRLKERGTLLAFLLVIVGIVAGVYVVLLWMVAR